MNELAYQLMLVYYSSLCSLLPVFNTLLDKLEGGGASSTARLAIGQAVAILFELGREVDSDLLESTESCETYSLIEQLATESNRYTARKERNQLRAHFRDVLQTLNVRWLASYLSHVLLHHMHVSNYHKVQVYV